MISSKRPDTPLAMTPEPQPITQGQIPMPPRNKFQVTADSAIADLNTIEKMNTPPKAQQTETQEPVK